MAGDAASKRGGGPDPAATRSMATMASEEDGEGGAWQRWHRTVRHEDGGHHGQAWKTRRRSSAATKPDPATVTGNAASKLTTGRIRRQAPPPQSLVPPSTEEAGPAARRTLHRAG